MNKTVIYILQRVLVNYFYKVNSGFFLFFFCVLFGTVNGSQLITYHLSLIQGMIENYIFLGCVIIIWLLYTFKCINYIIKQLQDPKQNFLFVLNVLPQRSQFLCMLYVHMMVYMPVFAYAITVASIAAKQHFYGSMFLVIISNLVMITGAVWLYRFYLQKKIAGIATSIPGIQFPKPLFSIPIWFIWKERKQMFFVTKIFSLLLLYGFINLYQPDYPDIRPILLIMMLVAAAHSAVILQIRRFQEEEMFFSKNLPVPKWKSFAWLLLMYFLLLLPEFVFMWKGFPVHFMVTDVPQILVFVIGLLVFFHSLLLMRDIDEKSYFRFIFITCAALFFILLYNPGFLFALFILLLSSIFYHSHVHDFEKNMEIQSE